MQSGPRVAQKSSTAPAAPPAPPITNYTPSISEVPAHSSLELPHHSPLPPLKDKEKQPVDDQSKKRKRAEEGSDAPLEVQQGSIMEYVRREARCSRYVSLNTIMDFRGRVVNIEDSYDNLPHRICTLNKYMNESITTEDWRYLTKRMRIESLNHAMLLPYKVSLTLFSPLLLVSLLYLCV